MNIKPFKCVEDVKEFIDTLSYEEIWETFDGYGELDDIKAEWDEWQATGNPIYDIDLLRSLVEFFYIRDNPLPYRFDLECQEKYGMSSAELMRRMDEDPFSLAPLYEEEDRRRRAENPDKNPFWFDRPLRIISDFNHVSIPEIMKARYEKEDAPTNEMSFAEWSAALKATMGTGRLLGES